MISASQPLLNPRRRLLAFLCFIGALLEGFDISAAGLTAQKFKAHYGMTSVELGAAFSASNFGMLFGAVIGGWLADRWGRKLTLSLAFLVLGLSTLATAFAPNSEVFTFLRVVAGLGIGGSIVNLMTLASALGPDQTRTARVTLLYSGVSFGGMTVSLVSAFLPLDYDWQLIFLVGGIIPILLSALYHFLFEEPEAVIEGGRATVARIFTEGRAFGTISLWVMCFATLMVVHLMINWLPSLVEDFGRSSREAAFVAASYSFAGGLSGAVFAILIRTFSVRLMLAWCYLAVVCGMLVMIGFGQIQIVLFLGASTIGFALYGAQFMIFGVGASFYPSSMLGTGMGLANGVGRVGSMVGPMLGGLAFQFGGGALGAMGATLPPLGLGFVAMLAFFSRSSRSRLRP